MDNPKVIYIMGCGRSGTTILDMIVGNHADFLSVGELNSFKHAWHQNFFCSCGYPVTKCEIWKKIGSMLFNIDDLYDYNKMQFFQASFEKQRAILKQFFGFYNNQKILDYQSYVCKIFLKLQELSSCVAVVDSSKSVGRAIALLRNDKLDARVIHIVRDPRGLFYSYQKKNVITPVKSLRSVALYWNSTNLLGSFTKFYFGNKRVLRIRYEDLVSRPSDTIDLIQTFLKVDMKDVKYRIDSGVPLERGHVASGNRIRTQKSPLILKADFSWKSKVSFFQQALLSILCFPLMLTYGYFKN